MQRSQLCHPRLTHWHSVLPYDLVLQRGQGPNASFGSHEQYLLDKRSKLLKLNNPPLLMIKALIWNTRGVASPATSHRLRKILRSNSVSFLVILEPMLDFSTLASFLRKFGFHLGLFNVSNKIWVC